MGLGPSFVFLVGLSLVADNFFNRVAAFIRSARLMAFAFFLSGSMPLSLRGRS